MIETQVRKFHTLLEKKIRQRGYEESDVEESLDWETGSIRRLSTGEQELKVEQVLVILAVIGVDQQAFFAELYGLAVDVSPAELAELKTLVGSVVNLLVKNGVVTADDLMSAVAAQVTAGDRAAPGLPSA